MLLVETEEAEHAHDMLLIGLADGRGGRVVGHIIVFLAEGKTRLVDAEDIVLAVFLVGSEIGAVYTSEALHGIFLHEFHQGSLGLGSLHLADERHDGLHTLTVAARRIHGELIIVAHLALIGTCGILFGQEILQDVVDTYVVVLP